MADTNKTTNTPDLGDKPELGNGKDGSGSYQMRVGFGTIAMLISATGMGLVPLFSRWATRTDMFDGAAGFNAGDSIGALHGGRPHGDGRDLLRHPASGHP